MPWAEPMASVRDRREFYELLDQKGSLLTVVTPEERIALPEKCGVMWSPSWTVEGFSLTKGKNPRWSL